jgi:hypothetical protein
VSRKALVPPKERQSADSVCEIGSCESARFSLSWSHRLHLLSERHGIASSCFSFIGGFKPLFYGANIPEFVPEITTRYH